MAWNEIFRCDICGKEKSEESEDWWLSWTERLAPLPGEPEQPLLKITRWHTFLSHDASVRHLCGQRCAQTLMDRWMTAKIDR
ncbi:hypothetical protein [Paracidobacterium acidisoli]|uniref:Uncharacterized protein n=1 Tax=Paracidobacterium acidisoli TaxID=2303751 RepID=A0A372IPQ3_9BACT|nr:hypothetical protein [Paracidobacterium acidisoli]MBT9331019.1 hypothetical protein [Paracidobacterium acidisoli]